MDAAPELGYEEVETSCELKARSASHGARFRRISQDNTVQSELP